MNADEGVLTEGELLKISLNTTRLIRERNDYRFQTYPSSKAARAAVEDGECERRLLYV